MGIYKCCVPNCPQNINLNNNVKKYKMPRTKEVRNIWLTRIGLDINNKSNFHRAVCRKHFADRAIQPSGRIEPRALPTIDLPCFQGESTKENIFYYTDNKFKSETPKIIKNLVEKEKLAGLSVLEEVEEFPNKFCIYEPYKKTAPVEDKLIKTDEASNKKRKLEMEETLSSQVDLNGRLIEEVTQCLQESKKNKAAKMKIENTIFLEDEINPKLEVVNKLSDGVVRNICRTCLKVVEDGNFVKLNKSDKQNDLKQRLQYCFSIELYEVEDGIVCKTCVNKIEEAYLFKMKLNFIENTFKRFASGSEEKPDMNEFYKLNKSEVESFEKEITVKEITPEKAPEKEIESLEENEVSIDEILKQQEAVKTQLLESVSKLKYIKQKKSSVTCQSVLCQFCGEHFLDIKSYYQHKNSCATSTLDEPKSSEVEEMGEVELSGVDLEENMEQLVGNRKESNKNIVKKYIRKKDVLVAVIQCISCRECFQSKDLFLKHLRDWPEHVEADSENNFKDVNMKYF